MTIVTLVFQTLTLIRSGIAAMICSANVKTLASESPKIVKKLKPSLKLFHLVKISNIQHQISTYIELVNMKLHQIFKT